MRLSVIAALIATAVIALPASAARATTNPIVGGGSFVRTGPFIDGWIYVFECHVVAPGATTTTVSSCSMSPRGPIDAPTVTQQGSAAYLRCRLHRPQHCLHALLDG